MNIIYLHFNVEAPTRKTLYTRAQMVNFVFGLARRASIFLYVISLKKIHVSRHLPRARSRPLFLTTRAHTTAIIQNYFTHETATDVVARAQSKIV